MAHTDTVNVDPAKWTFPPFSADARRRLCLRPRHGRRQGQRRRRADDDAAAEAARTCRSIATSSSSPKRARRARRASASSSWWSSTSRRSMPSTALPKAAASPASAGSVKFASVQTLEKIPRAIELTARGTAGHGSVPLQRQRHRPSVGSGRDGWRVEAADPAERDDQDLLHAAGRHSRRPQDADRYRDAVGCDHEASGGRRRLFRSSTSHGMPRCSALPSRRTSFRAAIASTSFRPKPKRRSTCACCRTRTRRVSRGRREESSTIRRSRCEYAARDVRPGAPSARLDSEAFKVLEAAVDAATTTRPRCRR